MNLDLLYVTYLFLHDPPGLPAVFADIGLRSNDGSVVRPADAVWRAEAAARK